MHRIFGGMDGSNYIWGEKIVIRFLAKDGYVGFLMTDGRLETYLENDLIWTSYFIGGEFLPHRIRTRFGSLLGAVI